MKLKSKPKPPVRKHIREWLQISSGTTLLDIINFADKFNIPSKDVKFECDYYDSDIGVILIRDEYDVDFQKRIDSYNKRLDIWTTWYNENKEEIEKEINQKN